MSGVPASSQSSPSGSGNHTWVDRSVPAGVHVSMTAMPLALSAHEMTSPNAASADTKVMIATFNNLRGLTRNRLCIECG